MFLLRSNDDLTKNKRIFQDKEAYFYPVSLYIGMDDLQRIVKIALFKSTNQIQDFIIE